MLISTNNQSKQIYFHVIHDIYSYQRIRETVDQLLNVVNTKEITL